MDEDPYRLPDIDYSKWNTGGHLGSQMQTTNWAIVNCTTPANYFHVLRRQVCSCKRLSLRFSKTDAIPTVHLLPCAALPSA